jgi:hypothetical protein
MLKHSLWLAIIGLLVAGGVFVYVQSRQQGLLPELPIGRKFNLRGNAVQRLPASETSRPPTANAIASAVAVRAYPPATALAPKTPNIFFPEHTLNVSPMHRSIFSAGRPDFESPAASLLEEFWTSKIFLESERKGDQRVFAIHSKEPEEGKPLTFSFSNKPGFGPQYLLIKNEDTAVLGRVASRFSRAYPGLSEEEHLAEVLFGCQLEHRLNQRSKVFSAVEYVRNPADLGRHWVRTQAAWEVLLDPEEKISLRSSILESSNYAPNGEQTKNLNYNLNLIWKF